MRMKPIDVLLPKTRQGILAALFMQPEKTWYASELARRMGVPPSSLQRELLDLTEGEIINSHKQGRMTYFQANTTSPLFPDLRNLFLKTAGLADVLANALAPFATTVEVAFVYGSVASGDEKSHSDIDLMLIGSVTPRDLAMPLRPVKDMLGRDINPTVYSLKEFREKRNSKDHFLTRVLDKPKLFVIGDSDGLENITR